ncbi:hypothetical protein ABPG74_000875 [Tetrahymena malaccensis]
MEIVDVREKDYIMINDIKVVKRKMWGKDSTKLENGISVHLDGSFGCYQTPIRKNTFFCTDDTLVYSCGNHLVLYDVVRKKQKYIMKNIEDQPLTAMNFFTNSKGEISVAVALKSKSDTLPQVKVYSSAKSFNYSLVHNMQNSIILDTAFILKSKYLITLTHLNKGFIISIYKVQKEKLACFRQIDDQEATKIEVFDKNLSEFIIYGKNFCKIYTFDYQGLIMEERYDIYAILQEALDQQFNDQIIEVLWLQETNTIVIACYENKLFLFKDYKYVQTIEVELFDKDLIYAGRNSKQSKQEQEMMAAQILEQQKQLSKSISISCMAKLQRGVAIGFQGSAMLSLYELDSTDKNLVHRGNFPLKEENVMKIHSIDIAPDDMYAVINVLFHQRGNHVAPKIKSDGVFATSEEEKKEQQGKLEIFMFNLAVVDAIRSVQKDPYEPLFDQGVHKGAILDLSVCPTRSFLVSICEDRTAKFIDFGTEFRELISQFFHESPLSVSIHPLSIQCAIGYKDGIKIFYILDDEIKHVYTNNTKPCTAISYSNGGHLLAAANGSMITIYNPYEFTALQQLNGHAAALKEIEWIDNDLKIISTCQNGLLNVWDIQTGQRVVEFAYKTHKLNAVTYDLKYDLVVCACADNKLRLFKEKGMTQICEYETSPCQFTSINIDKRFEVIIFGTSEGSVRIYLWPFWTFQSKMMEYLEIPIHQCSITSIKVSSDYQYLITASEDNSIFFSKIREYVEGEDVTAADLLSQMNPAKEQNNYYQNIDKITSAYSLNTLCLCSRFSQETKKESIKELEFRLQNYKSDIEDEKEKWEDIYSQRIKTLKEKHNDSKQKQKENLSNIYNDHEIRYNELKDKLSNQKNETEEIMEQMSEKNSKDLIQCYQIRDKLQEESLNLKKKYALQLDNAQNQYSLTLKKVEDEYNGKFNDIFNKYREALENVNNDQKKFHEVLTQQEQDFDTFFTSTKQNLKLELQDEMKRTEDLRSSNSKYNKEIQNYKERQVYLNQESEQLNQEIQNLIIDQQNFKEKYDIMSKQLSEKEDIINLREQQVKDLRSKNVHLQNFQKVYDYQVTTLKDERLPLKEHLTNMEKHVKNLYNELLEEAGTNKKIDKDIKQHHDHVKELKTQLSDKQEIVRKTQRLVDNFEYQILSMLRNEKFQMWPKMLTEIYNDNFGDSNKLEKAIEQSVIGVNLRELKKDQFLEQIEQEQQYLIGQDLRGQRDFLARQLVKVASDYRKVMESRNDAYLKVQNMNTLLINECNKMREEKQKLKEYLGVQKKAYREVKRQLAAHIGINFNEIKDQEHFPFLDDIDDELDEPEANLDDNLYDSSRKQFGEGKFGLEDDEFMQNEETLEQFKKDTISVSPNKQQANLSQGKSFSTMNFHSSLHQNSTKSMKKNPSQNMKDQLPFIQYQQKKSQSVSSIYQKSIKPLSVTEKKQNQKQLIQDLLKQIEDINDNEDSSINGEKLKERVQNFLFQEKKDTVGPLAVTQKNQPTMFKTSQNFALKKPVSQQRNSPNGGTESKISTASNFMQTFSSNLGFAQTGIEFNRKQLQSSQSQQQNQQQQQTQQQLSSK